MEKQPYLTQYCNLVFEWQSTGIDIDSASKNQQAHMQDLIAKAMEQCGMTRHELALISTCRCYKILKEVNSYTRRISY